MPSSGYGSWPLLTVSNPLPLNSLSGVAAPTVAIQTHGCKLNQADSDQLARRFVESGYRVVDAGEPADVFVLNTCTVTLTADSKARQALRRAHRANPGALIVATGCYAQRSRDELAQVDGVSFVVGNTGKEGLPDMVSEALGRNRRGAGLAAPVQPVPGNSEHPAPAAASPLWPGLSRNRAMVKIQEGCNQVCAYCIVPKVRGRERSIPPETLVDQINDRAGRGYREVVLTGTQLGTYGYDLPGMNLSALIERLLADTTVPRIRVSSLQAHEINPRLLDLWQDGRLCPHFHVPLQSGSGPVLRAMRRRYTTGQFAATLELIRSRMPDAGITTDVIVGFPGEGDAEFRESLDFARLMAFSDMHVFPFSPRPGTSAAYLEDTTPARVKKERTAEMLELSVRGAAKFRHSQLGSIRPVLWESSSRDGAGTVWQGLTDNYIRVRTSSGRDLRDSITLARLMAPDGETVSVEVR